MGFRTKIDFSDNRQVKQREQTTTMLFGETTFGLPFSGLTSGPNPTTSAATGVFENVISTFSGNNSTTIFTFGVPQMSGGETYLNTITPANSNDNQNVDPYFIGLNPSINPDFGNTVYASYSGSSFDFDITSFTETGPNSYSGTALSELVTSYSANTMDYSGSGIWVDVSGKTRTEQIIISKGATTGYVLQCVDSTGIGQWVNIKDIPSGNRMSSFINTETIVAEDNNIELNYGGSKESALDGGIKIINGVSESEDSELIIDSNGDWNFKPNIRLKLYTPESTNDEVGNLGNVCFDRDYYYIKTESGWKRINLENF